MLFALSLNYTGDWLSRWGAGSVGIGVGAYADSSFSFAFIICATLSKLLSRMASICVYHKHRVRRATASSVGGSDLFGVSFDVVLGHAALELLGAVDDVLAHVANVALNLKESLW